MKPGIAGGRDEVRIRGKELSESGQDASIPNDYNNFSPGVGFAWQVPWFGEGRTTVRGGYQVTYQGGGRFSTIQPLLAGAPGSSLERQLRTGRTCTRI